MGILNEEIITRINDFKSKIDDSKLEAFVQENHDRLVKQVIRHAPHLDKDNKMRGEEVIGNFKSAWEYALKNTQDYFDINHMQEVAGRVEPSLCFPGSLTAGLRQNLVVIRNTDCLPPVDGERIRISLEKMIQSTERVGMHPVEESLFTYFHLMRIQPFDNANKRTANIMMNSRLLHDGYSPVSIRSSEENLFSQYFVGALKGFKDDNANAAEELSAYLEPGIAQKQFYEFLANKISGNMSRIVDRLKGFNQYEILVDAKDPGAVWSLKKRIAGWFNRLKPVRIFDQKVDPKKGRVYLSGEIPYAVLDKIVKTSNGINNYKINLLDKR